MTDVARGAGYAIPSAAPDRCIISSFDGNAILLNFRSCIHYSLRSIRHHSVLLYVFGTYNIGSLHVSLHVL